MDTPGHAPAHAPLGRPAAGEAIEYYFRYIGEVDGDDVISALSHQLTSVPAFYEAITEPQSLRTYGEGKWSVRDVVGHVTDVERLFVGRALWFARGFTAPLPSFDQEAAVAAAQADRLPLAAHVADFARVRNATLSLFRSFSPEDWKRTGVASDNPFSVRAIAFIIAGHTAYHEKIVRERYLPVLGAP